MTMTVRSYRQALRRGARNAVASVMIALIGAQPILAQQAGIVASDGAQGGLNIDQTANGVPLVNIATPNAQGLSHNTYDAFNVGGSGAILNNANGNVSQTQLGGAVQGNANLAGRSPASVILNEVVSSERSALAGVVEVAGQSADVVIANPNGITCDGCGFIRTPRAVLTTGTPVVEGGALTGLTVEGGDIRFGAGGADLSSVSLFDIVTRQATFDGAVTGQTVRVAVGRNAFDYRTGAVTLLPGEDGSAPALAVDSTAVGGLYAGRISLISTEEGVAVRAPREMSANAGGMTLTADGRLVMGRAQAQGAVRAMSTRGAVRVDRSLFSGDAIEISGVSAEVAGGATLAAAGGVDVDADTVTLGSGAVVAAGMDADGTLAGSQALTITTGALSGDGARLAASGDLVVDATSISLNQPGGGTALTVLGDFTANTGSFSANGASGDIGGDVTLTAPGALTLSGGSFAVGGGLSATANSLSFGSGFDVARAVALDATAGDLDVGGDIRSDQTLSLAAAGDFDNAGRLEAGQTINIAAAGAARNTGTIAATTGLTVDAAAIANSGALGASSGDTALSAQGGISNSGLIYGGRDVALRLDGTLLNDGADIIAERTVRIGGLTTARAGSVQNRSANIEAIAGDLLVEAMSVANSQPVPTLVEQVTTETREGPASDFPGVSHPSNTYHVVQTITTTRLVPVAATNAPARMLAGGNIAVTAESVTNQYSEIAANGDVTLSAGTVTNTGQDLIETVETRTVSQYRERYCDIRIFGWCIDYDWRNRTRTTDTTATATTGAVFASIQAGGTVSADVSGYLGNDAVRSNAAQIGLSSGGRAVATPGGVGAINPDAILGRQGLFQPTSDPDVPFLIETRPEFVDVGAFLSSDYFFDRIGYDPTLVQRRFGDAYVEARLIQQQIFALTGQRTAFSRDALRALMQALYDNAADASEMLELTPGVALTPEQIAALTGDIVWMEEREVDGVTVLMPVLYLSGDTLDETMLASARISGGAVDLNVGSLGNSGVIEGDTGLRVAAAGDVLNSGGVLTSGGDVDVTATGRFANISGQVSGDDVTIAAGSVENSTAVLRDETHGGFTDRAQQTARIDARGDLSVTADGDLTAIGGQFTAGGDATLGAGGDIALGAAQRETRREESFGDGHDNSYRLENDLAGVTAGGNVSIGAGNDLTVMGAEIAAGGDAVLSAEGDITISSVQNRAQDDMVFDIDSGGLFGVETDIRRQDQQVTTERSTITAGGDIDVTSSGGDVTLRATRTESGGTTTLSAEEGRVAMLTTEDSTFERDERREEDLFWWNESDEGQTTTTRSHVEVEAGGGLKIISGGDVVVEYVATGDFDAGLAQLAEAPGLAWMGELRARDDIDWVEVETAFEEWDYESQGLTEAGALFVTAVTTFVLGPGIDALAANLAGNIGGGAAIEAAISAGLTSLSNQTAVALVNNRGDLGAALQQVMSDDSLRSLVTAMVSAGLTEHLTGVAGIAEVQNGTPLDTLRYEMQSGLVSASVNAAVSTAINGGDFGDALFDGWTNAMVMAGLAGAQHRIGDFALENGIDDGSIGHAVAHAVAGGLAAEALGRDFADGALGAALAALASTNIGESGLADDRQAELQNLIVTTAILVTSEGDVAGASLAGEIAASLHDNNYLNHAEAVERQEILDALWACNDSGECSDAEIAALQEDYRRMNALDEARDLALREACDDLYSSACAVELNRLNAAFKSYTEAQRNGEFFVPGVLPEYVGDEPLNNGTSVVALYRYYRQAFVRNAFVEAIMTLPVEAAGDAVDLATITARAAAGDQTARNQLVVLRDSVVASITDPVGTVEAGFEQVAARMDEAARLEAAGDWEGAAEIIGEVSAGFVYTATGVGGTAAAGTRVLSWVPDASVRTARPGGAVAVDTSRATRGTPEYELLNNPPPNTRVELDNGTTFRTNDAGFVEEITYTPVNQPGVRDNRQTAVGREGIAGDVGGHIQACRHGGTCDRFNLFPQNSNFNNSAYRRWENEITRSLQNGDNVGNVTVRLNRANSNNPRPDSVRIEYSINGEVSVRNFRNEAGG